MTIKHPGQPSSSEAPNKHNEQLGQSITEMQEEIARLQAQVRELQSKRTASHDEPPPPYTPSTEYAEAAPTTSVPSSARQSVIGYTPITPYNPASSSYVAQSSFVAPSFLGQSNVTQSSFGAPFASFPVPSSSPIAANQSSVSQSSFATPLFPSQSSVPQSSFATPSFLGQSSVPQSSIYEENARAKKISKIYSAIPKDADNPIAALINFCKQQWKFDIEFRSSEDIYGNHTVAVFIPNAKDRSISEALMKHIEETVEKRLKDEIHQKEEDVKKHVENAKKTATPESSRSAALVGAALIGVGYNNKKKTAKEISVKIALSIINTIEDLTKKCTEYAVNSELSNVSNTPEPQAQPSSSRIPKTEQEQPANNNNNPSSAGQFFPSSNPYHNSSFPALKDGSSNIAQSSSSFVAPVVASKAIERIRRSIPNIETTNPIADLINFCKHQLKFDIDRKSQVEPKGTHTVGWYIPDNIQDIVTAKVEEEFQGNTEIKEFILGFIDKMSNAPGAQVGAEPIASATAPKKKAAIEESARSALELINGINKELAEAQKKSWAKSISQAKPSSYPTR